MGLIDKILKRPPEWDYNTPRSTKTVLLYNRSSEYVPAYSLNPITHYFHQYSYILDKYKYKKTNTIFDRLLYNSYTNPNTIVKDKSIKDDSDIKNQVKANIESNLESIFSNDHDFVYYNHKYTRMNQLIQTSFSSKKLKVEVRSGKKFVSNFLFLYDYDNNKILFTFVLKKKYLDKARYLMLLGKELDHSMFELWIRKDFCTSPVYKYYLAKFKKEILQEALVDNIDIQIKDDFSDLFVNIFTPKFKTLKEQKEFFKTKGAELLSTLKSVYSIDANTTSENEVVGTIVEAE